MLQRTVSVKLPEYSNGDNDWANPMVHMASCALVEVPRTGRCGMLPVDGRGLDLVIAEVRGCWQRC